MAARWSQFGVGLRLSCFQSCDILHDIILLVTLQACLIKSSMTRFRLLALLFELISMVSLQQKLFALVNEIGLPPIQNETAVSEALYCLANRGTNGRWVRNHEDQSADDAWTARWRWREDSGCFVSTGETQQDWCTLMNDLNITRVLTAGDSTMRSFAKSFRTSLLDNSTAVELATSSSLEEDSELPCGLQHKHIELSRYPLHLDREPSLLSDDESGRILVVVSLGVPTKRVLDFHANLVNLLEWIDEWRQPNDLIFYRSSVPASTSSRASGPYIATKNSETSRVESYNEHANGFLPELKIWYLNVFNSALLPPSEVNFGTSYPSGIFDVWVHMMYSSLLDVRTLEEQPSRISLAIQ